MTPEPAHGQHARVLPMRDRTASDDDFTRVPPNDVEAEQAVVGALMLAPDVIAEVSALMEPADHYRPAHETIHRAILDLNGQGHAVDPITLGHHLEQTGDLPRIGGRPYLHTLVGAVPSAANAAYYAEIVHGHAQRRRSIEAGTRLVQAGMTPDATPEDLREALAASAEALPGTWGEPIPLTTQPQLPPFPSHVLPSWLREFVDAVAEETQTPADLAGTLALAVLATASGGRVIVQLRGRWREPTNLFTVVALPPGNRKSAVFSALTSPLRAAEKLLVSSAAGRIAEAEVTAKMAREAADKAATQAAKAEGMERDGLTAEAIALAQAADSLEVPNAPRLLADDSTPETVTTLMSEQGGRLSVMSAEGGIFDIIAGRYSGTPNMEVFLKGHAGDWLRVDRRTRAENIESPALTMGLAVQPSVLKDIGQNRVMDGRGLLARFLYALPESLVGYRKANPDQVPEHVAEAYERTVTGLTLSLAEWTDPAILRLTPEADAVLGAYNERVEPQLRARGGRLGHVTEWASKLVGATARIAGLLHLGEHLETGYTKPIAADTMSAAVELGDYFAAHALTVFDLMGADATLARARGLLTVLQDNGWESVTRRDLFAKVSRSEFPTVADLEPTVTLLEEHGYLRSETPPRTGKRGRPPAPRYVIHPALREAKA
ncbi:MULTISPECIES: DUF3987 domain-containing protein [unclassified Streptomyces]|uniref:DUF3987 domain-containing protein n=1 Tax=unclassified Streptomyces TaxID=2593676 RepID=UPI002E199FA1|nr:MULTISPECIES: DUF3987 domain-containing protein [unclassified Streptomyces]